MSVADLPPRRPVDRVPVRPDLEQLEAYGAPQLDVPVRLNTNETADAPSSAFLDNVADAIRDLALNRYPDRPATELRAAIGRLEGLPADRVWAANGSNEVLLQLFQAYGGPDRSALLFRPGYSAHPLLAQVAMTPVVEHDLPGDFVLSPEVAAEAGRTHHPDIAVVANPNNPTGIAVPVESIRALHDACDALIIVDEAYVEFGAQSARGLLDELPRLVVTRTFSKAFRLAGLRLGYFLGQTWMVEDIQKVRLPYHLDAIKQAAGIVALEHRAELLDHIERVTGERGRIMAALSGLDVEVFPSTGNFLLFRTDVPGLFDQLLDQGVLVRDFSRAPRLEGCLRVTVGTPDENDRFLVALRDALKENA